MKTFTEEQALEELKSNVLLKKWEVKAAALYVQFIFKDFREAMQFMLMAGKVAEEQDHHPEWTNVWNRIEIRLSTHSAGGITEKDFKLANAFQYIYDEGVYLTLKVF